MMSLGLKLLDKSEKANYGTRKHEQFGDDYGSLIRIACSHIRQLEINHNNVRETAYKEARIPNV